jgi:hypothetical protein
MLANIVPLAPEGGRSASALQTLRISAALGRPSFHHPADQGARGEAYRKRRRNRQHRMPLKALRCLTQEFLGGVATLFYRTLHHFDTIFDRIGNRTGCTRSLPG